MSRRLQLKVNSDVSEPSQSHLDDDIEDAQALASEAPPDDEDQAIDEEQVAEETTKGDKKNKVNSFFLSKV